MWPVIPTLHKQMDLLNTWCLLLKIDFSVLKYSGQDPHITLLYYCNTVFNVKLLYCGQMLFARMLCTTLTFIDSSYYDAVIGHLKECTDAQKQVHDPWSFPLAPLYAGQELSTLDTSHGIFITAYTVPYLKKNSYFIHRWSSSMFSCICFHMPEYQPVYGQRQNLCATLLINSGSIEPYIDPPLPNQASPVTTIQLTPRKTVSVSKPRALSQCAALHSTAATAFHVHVPSMLAVPQHSERTLKLLVHLTTDT